MQQADQTVLSLRPGGGNRSGGRLIGSRFDSSSSSSAFASSDLSLLRPHGGAFSIKVQSFSFSFNGSRAFITKYCGF